MKRLILAAMLAGISPEELEAKAAGDDADHVTSARPVPEPSPRP